MMDILIISEILKERGGGYAVGGLIRSGGTQQWADGDCSRVPSNWPVRPSEQLNGRRGKKIGQRKDCGDRRIILLTNRKDNAGRVLHQQWIIEGVRRDT
ncbi:hypothetical protein KIN20_020354 [Parelaphostrongylus tenuis]|uniref:Uncharacterized protein n=1 Tax=Parelaphostrongylus tenuis TaxID=148309 RepID=A0AAD5N400_PARTN|nr:hypothetical protein KIN20_020354 [Parelaphostrongylus tenuis]